MEDPSGSAFYHQHVAAHYTNLGASPSSPNFTFYSHFHFCFHFLPTISGSPKAEEKLLICITPCQKSLSPIPELSCSYATFLTK